MQPDTPPRFALEAWPTGTRERALRHALRYRGRARALSAACITLEHAQAEAVALAWAYEAEVVRLRAAIAEARRHLDGGDLGAARRALEGTGAKREREEGDDGRADYWLL